MRLGAMKGDITQVHAHVIVNAANLAMRGGGGVDGAIHEAAGPELLAFERWMYPTGLPAVGVPAATPAYRLPARHVVHVAGPDTREVDWRTTLNPRATWKAQQLAVQQLKRSYAAALTLADMLGARQVTFPSISTGIYGFPLERAAYIAADALRSTGRNTDVRVCCVVCFDDTTLNAFKEAIT